MSLSRKMLRQFDRKLDLERQRQLEESKMRQMMIYDEMAQRQRQWVNVSIGDGGLVGGIPWINSTAAQIWDASAPMHLRFSGPPYGDRDVFKPDAIDATHATDSRVPPPGIPRRLTRILSDAAAGIYPFTSPRLDHTQEAAVWMPGLEDMVDDWPDRA